MAFSLRLAQLVDSAFPTGAFAHSFGLETAAQAGRLETADDLRRWLSDFLYGSLAQMEGPAVLHAQATAARTGELHDLDRVLYLSRLTREARVGVQKIARQYLRMAVALYPELAPRLTTAPDSLASHSPSEADPAMAFRQYAAQVRSGECYGHPTIVHGCLCAFLGEPPESAVASYLFSALNILATNAQRTTGIGQTQAQQTMCSVIPAIERVTAHIVHAAPAVCRFSVQNVLQEIDAMRHETLYSRLFMS